MNWKLFDKIRKIVNKNIEEIPYEGKDIDVNSIVDSCCELHYELMKGFITYVFNCYTNDSKHGYYHIHEEKYYSREEMINKYFDSIKLLS